MIEEILPESVVAEEQFGPHTGLLLAEEAEILGRAVLSRRAEFMAGRTCARKAIEAMRVPVQPILVGAGREPIWPARIVGSITHCELYCAAVVGHRDEFLSIGIDAEPNETLPDGVLTTIAREEEICMLRNLPLGHIQWDRVLFCAKECVYKTWYPIMKCWLGFEEASVTIDPDNHSFQVHFLSEDPRESALFGRPLTGRYLVSHGYIVSSVVMTRQDADRRDEPRLSYTNSFLSTSC
jgi:4'-phosphopantetheinyl transferase EntD